MHRTDATDAAADIGNGNPGFKEIPPGNETIVAANFMNAVQEELCKVIEDSGGTVRATGAADAAAFWGQLSPAIQTLIDKKGVIANATSFGMGTGETGADNLTALNLAFASSKLVYIPAGTYQLEGNPTIPDGSVLIGDNGLTILDSGTSGSGVSWGLIDKNVWFRGIQFLKQTLPNHNMTCGHTTEKFTIFQDCIFAGTNAQYILINTSTDNAGVVRLLNCHFNDVDRAIEVGAASTGCPRIQAEGCFFDSSEVTIFNASPASYKYFRGNRFNACSMRIEGANTYFENNEFDGSTTWFLDATVSCIVRNNVFNTTPSFNLLNDPRFYFNNNRDRNGKILVGEQNINGVFINYERSASIVIGFGASQAINFNSKIKDKMSFHDDYAADDVYNETTGLMTMKGLGSGKTRINCQLIVTEPNSDDVLTTLRVNGTKTHVFSKSPIGATVAMHRIDIELVLDNGDTVDVFVENNAGAGNTTVHDTLSSLKSFLLAEGF